MLAVLTELRQSFWENERSIHQQYPAAGFNWMASIHPWPRGRDHHWHQKTPTSLDSVLSFRPGAENTGAPQNSWLFIAGYFMLVLHIW